MEISPTTSRPKVAELSDGESNVGRDATGNFEKKAGEEEEEEEEEEAAAAAAAE